MFKRSHEQPRLQEQALAKEPVFATPEELAEKEELLQSLKQAEQDKSIEGLNKQKEILIKLTQLDERRKQRIAKEKGEVVLGELPEEIRKEYYEITWNEAEVSDFAVAKKDLFMKGEKVYTAGDVYLITGKYSDIFFNIEDGRGFKSHHITKDRWLNEFIPLRKKK